MDAPCSNNPGDEADHLRQNHPTVAAALATLGLVSALLAPGMDSRGNLDPRIKDRGIGTGRYVRGVARIARSEGEGATGSGVGGQQIRVGSAFLTL
jgi:hypothetical protein